MPCQSCDSCGYGSLGDYSNTMAGCDAGAVSGVMIIPQYAAIGYDALQHGDPCACGSYPSILDAYGAGAGSCNQVYSTTVCGVQSSCPACPDCPAPTQAVCDIPQPTCGGGSAPSSTSVVTANGNSYPIMSGLFPTIANMYPGTPTTKPAFGAVPVNTGTRRQKNRRR